MKILMTFCVIMSFLIGTAWGADVTLEWNPSPEDDLAEYCIYRAAKEEGQSGEWSLVTCGINDNTYTDSVGNPLNFMWLVTAKDEAGNESKASNVTWKEPDSTPPDAVIEIRIVVSQ